MKRNNLKFSVWLFLVALICPTSFAQEGGDRVLGRFDFETAGALDAWDGSERPQKGAEFCEENPHSGKGCLLIAPRIPQGAYLMAPSMQISPAGERRSRMVRVSLFTRAIGVSPGGAYIQFIKIYGSGRYPDWLRPDPADYGNNVFAVLPVGPDWTKAEAAGPVDSDVRELSLRIGLANPNGKAKLWVDGLTVELLDRGLEFQSPVHCFLYEGEGGRADVNLFAGETGKLPLVISGSARLKSGSVRLLDEEGRALNTIPIPPNRDRLDIELPTRGFYEIEASAIYDDGTIAQTRTTAVVTGPKIPDALRLNSPFGLHSPWGDLAQLSGAGWDRDFFGLREREDYRRAAEAGFPAGRKPVVQRVEPKDRKMVRALCDQPDWMQDRKGKPFKPNNDYYPPKDWDTFYKFIQYVMRSFEGGAHYIEVANEPDDWQGSWAEFVKYNRVMAKAVKSVAPKAKFLGPAFCQIEMSRVRAVVDAGLLDTIDMFSIHPYINGTQPEGEFIQKVRELKAYLAEVAKKKNRPRIPICLSEYGWNLPPGDWQKPVDPLTQARYVSRSSILLVAEQIDSFIYFLTRAGEGPTSGPVGYNLMNWDWTPRPGFAAYANVARMLTGVSGPGKCLQLTPTTWMVLFRKGDNTMAAAWDTKGSARVLVPKPWGQARDMMGRPLPESADGMISVSPSPVFIELPGLDFYRTAEDKDVVATPGETIPLAWTPAWIPPAFQASEKGISVAPDAPNGTYQVVGKTPQGWRTRKVDVQNPLVVETVDLIWPARDDDPSVKVVARSNLSEAVTAVLTCHLPESRKTLKLPADLPANGTKEVTFSLPGFVPGKRYLGQVVLETTNRQPAVRAVKPLDVTVIPCRSGKDWQNVPVMDFTAWPRAGEKASNIPAAKDITARMQVRYDNIGLHFRIVVGDAVHRQRQGSQSMWMDDSVQLAFDMDADKPWIANVGGFAGHVRIFEYGAALGVDGPMVWRWISYDKSLPGGSGENRVQADITRTEQETVYTLTFPWAVLGAAASPPPGSRVGFSFLVNDEDGDDGRRSLDVFGGIGDAKDPMRYGALWIR